MFNFQLVFFYCSNGGKTPGKESGHWSSTGCSVQWSKVPHTNRTVVNCTCWHLSTFAVVMDLVDEDRIPDASLAEEVMTTIGLGLAILSLTMALTVFCLLRGLQTNSNTIHKNLALCTLLISIVFLIALRMRKTLVHKEVSPHHIPFTWSYDHLRVFEFWPVLLSLSLWILSSHANWLPSSYIICTCVSFRGWWWKVYICTGCWQKWGILIMVRCGSTIQWDMVSCPVVQAPQDQSFKSSIAVHWARDCRFEHGKEPWQQGNQVACGIYDSPTC